MGSNIALEGMQPALTQSDARSALSPIKKRTFAPNLCAVRAAVRPADPPPMTATTFCFMDAGLFRRRRKKISQLRVSAAREALRCHLSVLLVSFHAEPIHQPVHQI